MKILPSKRDLSSLLHGLYDSLGGLLRALPDFRHIGADDPSVPADGMFTPNATGTLPLLPATAGYTSPEAGATRGFEGFALTAASPTDSINYPGNHGTHAALTKTNGGSGSGSGSGGGYFSYVQGRPILRAAGAYSYASAALAAFAAAYEEACACGGLMASLEDACKRLWSINPRGLATQMEKSLVLAKLKHIMAAPDSVDDVSRTLDGEKKRIASLRKAVGHLREAQQTLEVYPELKQPLGLVTSFQAINGEVMELRNIQYERLYGNMPKTFTARAGAFVAYAKVLPYLPP